jgi:hypothetical protein
MVNMPSYTLPFVSLLLAAQSSVCWCSPVIPKDNTLSARGATPYLQHARQSIDILNENWYNQTSGYWNSQWWQSANVLAMIGDYAALDPSFTPTAEKIYANSYMKAANGGQSTRFLGKFYDDMGWWAIA